MTSPHSTSPHPAGPYSADPYSADPYSADPTATTSNDPDQIRREIEQTQATRSSDVDALTEKVSPAAIAQRRVDRVRGTASRWKDKVMGSDTDADPYRPRSAPCRVRLGIDQWDRAVCGVDDLRHRLRSGIHRAGRRAGGSAGGRAPDARQPARGGAHCLRRGLARVLVAPRQPARAATRRAGEGARERVRSADRRRGQAGRHRDAGQFAGARPARRRVGAQHRTRCRPDRCRRGPLSRPRRPEPRPGRRRNSPTEPSQLTRSAWSGRDATPSRPGH
jgi:hypothetical protein